MWVTTVDRSRVTSMSESWSWDRPITVLCRYASPARCVMHTPLLPLAWSWGSSRSAQKRLFSRTGKTGSPMGSVGAELASLIFRFLPNWKNTAL